MDLQPTEAMLFQGYQMVEGRQKEVWCKLTMVGLTISVEEVFKDVPANRIHNDDILFEDSACAISGTNLYVMGGRNGERRNNEDCSRRVRSLNIENPSQGWLPCADLTVKRAKHMPCYAGNLVLLLPGRYNVLQSRSLLLYDTNLNSCVAIPPPSPCLDCNTSFSCIDNSFNPKFCAPFGDQSGFLVCNSVGDHLYAFQPGTSWEKICHTKIRTVLSSSYELREFSSLNGILYLSYFCQRKLKTKLRVYDIRTIQFGDPADLLREELLPDFGMDKVRNPKRFLVVLSDYKLCYMWKDASELTYKLARVDIPPNAPLTVNEMKGDLDDTIHIINCIRL
ncbi:hypothetical protein SLA2020_301110 [Shorea laevis]